MSIMTETINPVLIATPIEVEPIKPDTCTRQYKFDIFTRQHLFPCTRYDLLLKRNENSSGNDYLAALKKPRFKFKSRYCEFMFYVDVKYLLHKADPMIEWCEPSELKRYQELDEQIPVYIMIGEGSYPAEPQGVFIFPIKNVRYNRILRSRLEKYRIPAVLSVEEEDLVSMRLDY